MPTRPLAPGPVVRVLAALSLLADVIADAEPNGRAAFGRRGNAVRVPTRVGRDARR
jgi:hypothetical protein